jgi:hypothetical protein
VETYEVHYGEHVFRFERLPGNLFEGRLLLNNSERELLIRLVQSEDERCLGENGERLPAGLLFDRSPWSFPGPAGPIKLLCRFLDLTDGRSLFSTPDSYLEGGLFDWMRPKRSGDSG